MLIFSVHTRWGEIWKRLRIIKFMLPFSLASFFELDNWIYWRIARQRSFCKPSGDFFTSRISWSYLYDSGTQLVGANKIHQGSFKILNEDFFLKEYKFKGLRWEFAPICAPWRQACAESLISLAKNFLFFDIVNASNPFGGTKHTELSTRWKTFHSPWWWVLHVTQLSATRSYSKPNCAVFNKQWL